MPLGLRRELVDGLHVGGFRTLDFLESLALQKRLVSWLPIPRRMQVEPTRRDRQNQNESASRHSLPSNRNISEEGKPAPALGSQGLPLCLLGKGAFNARPECRAFGIVA